MISGEFDSVVKKNNRRNSGYGHRVFLVTGLLLFLSGHFLLAQLIQVPPPHYTAPVQKSKASAARTKAVQVLTLPFWDDFSTTRKGRPDTLWIDSNSVSINDGTGINAPTINVATFNGLDSVEAPYNPNEQTAKGLADKLISRPIKMGLSSVSLAGRDSVYLSFFYQWKGNQEPPDQYDFLRVEFKNAAGAWEIIETIYGDQNLDSRKFYTKIIKITGTQFFHDSFQFRIRNFGRLSGPYDTWNVDYIYLNKSRISSVDFPDQAIASSLTSLFGEYRSIPVWQFIKSQEITAPTFGLHNLKSSGNPEPINYMMLGTFINWLNDSVYIRHDEVLKKDIADSDTIKIDAPLDLLENRILTLEALPDANDTLQFNPNAKALDIKLKLVALTGDVYIKKDTIAPDYKPRLHEFKFKVDFRVNDTLSTTYHLENYFAYDDGSAEFAVNLGQPGNRAALRFDLPTPKDPNDKPSDRLMGFNVYFPFFKGATSQTMDFFVYEDDNGKPAQIPVRSLLSRTITKNNANTFFFIDMRYDEALILTKPFYFAWKEPASERLHIGLDKSFNTGNKLYQNIAGTWEPTTDVTGSLMVRAVVAPANGAPIQVGIPEERPDFAIHPNPNNGIFYIDKMVQDVEVTDITGKRIACYVESNGNENRVSLSTASSGIYVVRWKEKNGVHVRKIVVR